MSINLISCYCEKKIKKYCEKNNVFEFLDSLFEKTYFFKNSLRHVFYRV